MPVTMVPGQRRKFSYTPFELTLLASINGMPPNNVYFVNSVTGTNDASRGSKDQPLASIDYAVGLCTASKGDVILALPGHVETIGGAAALAVDVAGVSIIGLGTGKNRPVLDFTNTAGTVSMAAANTLLANMVVKANVSAVVIGIDVNAADVELAQLFFTYDATGDDFLTIVDCTTVDRTYIHDCVFESENAVGGTEAINLTATNDTVIENNVFRGNWSDAIIQVTTTLCARLIIRGNIGYNSDTGVYNGIDTGTLSTTGVVANNTITALYATAVAKIYRDGDLTSHNNFWCNEVSERASTILPATSSG